jgi:hypothetical protein
MSYDNSFDRMDLHDPSRERHDDARDNDPYYGFDRPGNNSSRQQDHYYDMMTRYERSLDRRTMRLLTASLIVARHRTRKLDWYFQ